MAKSSTKSSGIRMPIETYAWIDKLAAKHGINRSQCVCELLDRAKRSLTTKPKSRLIAKPKVKQPWTVNAAWIGYFCTSAVIGSFITVLI
jgi:hypothetical protein